METVRDITEAEVVHTCFRIAQISVGISWSNNIDRHMAGILASHTVSVFLCHLSVAFNEGVKEIIKEAVEDGQNIYYNLHGLPYTKPKGKPVVNFTKRE